MPIYEYECGACQHRFEALQKISDSPLTECPVCSEHSLRKLVSAAAFRLKGGGWYETDFKTGNKKNLSAADGGDKAASKEGGGGKQEAGDAKVAKPAEKAAAPKAPAS